MLVLTNSRESHRSLTQASKKAFGGVRVYIFVALVRLIAQKALQGRQVVQNGFTNFYQAVPKELESNT